MAALAAAAMVAAATISRLVFGGIPHVQDSIAQLFQARIFALGRLWVPSPPLPRLFDYAQMINDGRWYSQYPPGHPLLLLPWVLLGVPWLANPVLGGLGLLFTMLLARELFDDQVALLAGVMGLLSPFFLFMASEFMSHVSGFATLTGFVYFYFRMRRTGRVMDAAAAGLCLCLALLVRPYTAAAMALPVALHALHGLRSTSAPAGTGTLPASRLVLLVSGGGLAGILLLLLYNLGTTGDAMVPGYIKLYGPSHGLGFGKGSWGSPHTLERGLLGTMSSLASLNGRLFEWPGSSLWPLAAALVASVADRGPGRAARGALWMLAALPACVLAAYVFYWYRDLCFGPRFIYDALGPILILSAWGFRRVTELLSGIGTAREAGDPGQHSLDSRAGRKGRGGRDSRGGRGARTVIVGAVVLAALSGWAAAVGWPRLWRISDEAREALAGTPVRMASYFQAYSPRFWGVSPYLGELIRRQGVSNALVLVRNLEPENDAPPMRHLWFGSAFAHQRPDVSSAGVIFARDRGVQVEDIARAFPGRAIYRYTGTIEGGTLQRLDGEGAAISPAGSRTPAVQAVHHGLAHRVPARGE